MDGGWVGEGREKWEERREGEFWLVYKMKKKPFKLKILKNLLHVMKQ